MNRLLVVAGVLAAASGVAVMIPAIVEYQDSGSGSGLIATIISLGIILIVGGGVAIMLGRPRPRGTPMPPTVRAAVTAAILFLAFCMLEFSDGLVRQGGRIFYWTTVLFLPALALLYGLVSARRWAWWITRIASAIAVLWFATFLLLIPFVDLRADGVPVPRSGRVYMAAVTFIFAAISAYTFRALGHAEARRYFGNDRRTDAG